MTLSHSDFFSANYNAQLGDKKAKNKKIASRREGRMQNDQSPSRH